jgi:hypothetical protein
MASRKASAYSLVDYNLSTRIPRMERLLASLESDPKDERAYQEFINETKAALEALRSALDYLAHDIADLAKKPSADDDVYFPFVHAKPGQAGPVVRKRFETRMTREDWYKTFPNLRAVNRPVYDLLMSIQGAQWISDLIRTVNPAKHDKLPDVTKTEMLQLGNPEKGPSYLLRGIKVEKGAKLIIGDKTIEGPVDFTPGSALPPDLSDVLQVRSVVERHEAEKQILAPIRDWSNKIKDLLLGFYKLIS